MPPREASNSPLVGSTTADSHRNPISIALLFYLVTLAAIVAASLGRLSSDEFLTTQALWVSIVAGAVIGSMIGIVVGLTYLKSGKAAVAGLSVGLVLGCVAGALALVNTQHFLSNMAIAFGGGWLVILMILMTTRNQARTQ